MCGHDIMGSYLMRQVWGGKAGGAEIVVLLVMIGGRAHDEEAEEKGVVSRRVMVGCVLHVGAERMASE